MEKFWHGFKHKDSMARISDSQIVRMQPKRLADLRHIRTGLGIMAYCILYGFFGDEYFLTSSRLETLMVGCFVTVTGSILFVEIYRITKSVWPCVILHSVQNSISTALAVTGASVQYEGGAEVVFDPVTGILSIIILVGVGLPIRKKRIALDNHPIPH